jgi:hypothetical protein
MAIGVALRLQKEIPGAVILDQYHNVRYSSMYASRSSYFTHR